MTDGFMEPHPLWEYPSYPLSKVYEIFEVDFTKRSLNNECIEKPIRLDLENEGLLNGVAIWHTIEFDQENIISTGLVESPRKNKHLKWTKDYKQAVHILDQKVQVTCTVSLTCYLKFEPKLGKFNVDFKIEK